MLPLEIMQFGQCRNKCNDLITDEYREKLFRRYWITGDFNRRLGFTSSLYEVILIDKEGRF